MEGRTVERQGSTLELLDTVAVVVRAWQERGNAQRWVSLRIASGPSTGFELFVPFEALENDLSAPDGPGAKAVVE